MKNFLIRLSSCVVILFCFSSCVHYHYIANEAHLTGLSEKGEIKVSAGVDLGGDQGGAGFSGRAGISPVNHIGIQASHFYFSENEENTMTSNSHGKGALTELSLGTYWWFTDPEEETFSVLADLYIGYGLGRARNFYGSGGRSTLSFHKLFIQPALHFSLSRRLQFIFAYRLVQLDYQKATLINEVPENNVEDIFDIQQQNPFPLNEFTFRLSGGNQNIQSFASVTISGTTRKYTLAYPGTTVHVGIIANMSNLLEK